MFPWIKFMVTSVEISMGRLKKTVATVTVYTKRPEVCDGRIVKFKNEKW